MFLITICANQDSNQCKTYCILIDIFFIIRDLWWVKEIKKAFTILCFSNWWLDAFGPLLRLLPQNLLCQIFPWKPFNLRPTNFHDSQSRSLGMTRKNNNEETVSKKKKNSNSTWYPIAFSKICSSSLIISYVFVSTSFLK